jgi:hypothetical protein
MTIAEIGTVVAVGRGADVGEGGGMSVVVGDAS